MDTFALFGRQECDKEIATAFAKAKPSKEHLSYTIDSIEGFDIPEDQISSLEKLVLNINFVVDEDDYKNIFEENCFVNVTEAHLTLDNKAWEEGEIDQDEMDYQYNNLIVALANAIPNVKKLIIRSNAAELTLNSLKTVVSNCRKLEFLKFKITQQIMHHDEMVVRNDNALEDVIPIICRDLQNLRFLQLDHWCMHWKEARHLLLHSKQLQAYLSYRALNVRSTAQMTEVANFFVEARRDWLEETSFGSVCFY